MVSAFSGTLAHPGIEVEDTLSAILKWESGAMGTITASTACHPGLDLSIEESGDAGTAVLVNGLIEFWQFAEERSGDEAIRAGGESKGQGGASDPKAISCAGDREQIRILCESIRSGSGQPGIIDGTEACTAVRIVESIYKSARSLRAESVFQ